jgi:hypothetical protein
VIDTIEAHDLSDLHGLKQPAPREPAPGPTGRREASGLSDHAVIARTLLYENGARFERLLHGDISDFKVAGHDHPSDYRSWVGEDLKRAIREWRA